MRRAAKPGRIRMTFAMRRECGPNALSDGAESPIGLASHSFEGIARAVFCGGEISCEQLSDLCVGCGAISSKMTYCNRDLFAKMFGRVNYVVDVLCVLFVNQTFFNNGNEGIDNINVGREVIFMHRHGTQILEW
jgi:hypothetical protein